MIRSTTFDLHCNSKAPPPRGTTAAVSTRRTGQSLSFNVFSSREVPVRPVVKHIIPLSVAAVAIMSVATSATAQAKQAGSKSAQPLTWGPAPDAFPAGAKMAVERGDPTKSGEFVVRFQFPAGYKIPPHWHPFDEHVRVMSGEFIAGMGDVLDTSKARKLAPGDTIMIGAKMHHFAMTPTATDVRVRAMGPFAMTYVNPADDPRKKH